MTNVASYSLTAPKGSPARMGLIANYDLVLDFGDGRRIEVGRFSHGVLGSIVVYAGDSSSRPASLVKIGAFCESADDTVILVGGEHRNESIFNLTFGKFGHAYKSIMDAENQALTLPRYKRPIIIGDGVILSHRSIVTADIGTGCVIGAGAVVTRRCADFGVYGGAPAVRIRDRFDEPTQRKFTLADPANVAGRALSKLPVTLAEFQADRITYETMREQLPLSRCRPVLVMSGVIGPNRRPMASRVIDILISGKPLADDVVKSELLAYFNQIHSEADEIKWSPDILADYGQV